MRHTLSLGIQVPPLAQGASSQVCLVFVTEAEPGPAPKAATVVSGRTASFIIIVCF